MKFIDEAEIQVKAGDGGPGARHFRREKFVPLGGPDGGDGGEGGDIVLIADRNVGTLLDFKFNFVLKAESGEPGGGNNRSGKSGESLRVKVPIGTQVVKLEDSSIVADLNEDGQEFVIAKGGRGGKGNNFFKTPTNRAPEHFQPGEQGESGSFMLSLKLVADVGLIGMPNAGKSTLISRISAARPKIADYPFTTLTPNLGVVQAKGGRSFVVADIPGLIPGAHTGKGLGTKFLKHVERTRVLAHLVDPFQIDEHGEAVDPLETFRIVNDELAAFSPELSGKPQIVVITKADLNIPDETADDLIEKFRTLGFRTIIISSASGRGIDQLIEALATLLF